MALNPELEVIFDSIELLPEEDRKKVAMYCLLDVIPSNEVKEIIQHEDNAKKVMAKKVDDWFNHEYPFDEEELFKL